MSVDYLLARIGQLLLIVFLAITFFYGLAGTSDDAHWQRVSTVLDRGINVLAPLITLLLGYVFGSQRANGG